MVILIGLLALIIPSAAFAAAPPLDPTYGLPLPSQSASSQAGPPIANWIWGSQTSDNQDVYLRRAFTLPSMPKAAELYVNGDDSFTAYVNGHVLQQTIPVPPSTSTWQVTQTFDITSLMQPGKNVVAIIGHNISGAAGVAACLSVNNVALLASDTSWKVSMADPGSESWTTADFDDTAWPNATAIAPTGGGVWATVGPMSSWPTYLLQDASYLSHINLPFVAIDHQTSDGASSSNNEPISDGINHVFSVTPAGVNGQASLLLDFGKEIAGRVVIEPLTSGTVIVSRGESIGEALNAPFHGPVTLTLTPSVQSSTVDSAFRYVKLDFPNPTGAALSPVRFQAFVDHKYYPVEYGGSFDCSDPLLTKIWYTGAYTCHLCMQENIWDAPKRDRREWVGDLHVSGEVINDVFADKFLMEKTLTYLRDDTDHGQVNGIPGYSCAWICCLADFHRHIGDYKFLAQQHDRLLAVLQSLHDDLDTRGMFTNPNGAWLYTDWSPGFSGDNALTEATTHLFLTKAVNEAAYLLNEMGDTANAQKCTAWATALKANAQQYLADPSTGVYSNRLQENAMAIYSDAASPKQTAAIYANVLDPSSESWNRDGKLLGSQPVMTPYFGNYIITAMSMAGHTSDALSIIRSFWGGMIAEGATTFWEAYDPAWPKTDFHVHLISDYGAAGYFVSLCHGWSCGPTSFLTERVLGVQSTGAGFKTAIIEPDLAGLAWAEGTVPTPSGAIHVRAAMSGSTSTITVELPSGVDATVLAPGSNVTLNGTPAGQSSATSSGKTSVTLNRAGKYIIVSRV
jgi:hypothetical protein